MDHQSEVEVCREQTNANNNLPTKESSGVSLRLQSELNNSHSNVSFDYEDSSTDVDSFFIERQDKLRNINNNTTNCPTLNITECLDTEKTNKIYNNLNDSDESAKDNHVVPSLTGLKNTAMIAVDVIREKFNSLRRPRSFSNTQTATRDNDYNATNGSVLSLKDGCISDGWQKNTTFESFGSIEKRAFNNEHSTTIPHEIQTKCESTNESKSNESKMNTKTEHVQADIKIAYNENDSQLMSPNSTGVSTAVSEKDDQSTCAFCDEELGREQQPEISFTSLCMINNVNKPKTKETKTKNREAYLNGAKDFIEITQTVQNDEYSAKEYANSKISGCSPSTQYENNAISEEVSNCTICADVEVNSLITKDNHKNSNSTCNLEEDECNIKLWQVRNRLEETTIEIRCHYVNYDNANVGEYQSRCLSITTDGMTEASPLSTPSSSERALSREKSLSDFDYEYESKGYFVTDSGRLSPLPPACHCRSSTTVSNSPERPLRISDDQDDACSCEGQKIPSEDANKSLHRHDPNTQPKMVSNAPSQEDANCRKLFPEDKNDLKTVENQSEMMEDVDLSKSPSPNKSPSLMKEVAAKTSSLTDNRKHPQKKLEKRSSLFSLLNKKASDIRRVSLPSLERQKPPETINKKSKHLFLRRFSNADLTKRSSGNATPQLKTQTPLRSKIQAKQANDLKRKSLVYKNNSVASDDVFVTDPVGKLKTKFAKLSLSAEDVNSRRKSPFSKSKHHKSGKMKRATRSMSTTEFISPRSTLPASSQHRRNTMFQTSSQRPTSVDEMMPCSSASCSKKQNPSIDESDDSSSSFASSRSSSSRKTLSRFFRRTGRKPLTMKKNSSTSTFCGYSIERDYCVDSETDRIFKEFLFNDNPTITLSPSEESCSSPPHVVSPLSPKGSRASQLRRQSMIKQNSDSVAIYHGQNQRRMRFAKQRSGSLNYPVDQDRIEEEFDSEEMTSSRYSAPSSRSHSNTTYHTPTVNEVKKWTRTNEYHLT